MDHHQTFPIVKLSAAGETQVDHNAVFLFNYVPVWPLLKMCTVLHMDIKESFSESLVRHKRCLSFGHHIQAGCNISRLDSLQKQI